MDMRYPVTLALSALFRASGVLLFVFAGFNFTRVLLDFGYFPSKSYWLQVYGSLILISLFSVLWGEFLQVIRDVALHFLDKA